MNYTNIGALDTKETDNHISQDCIRLAQLETKIIYYLNVFFFY